MSEIFICSTTNCMNYANSLHCVKCKKLGLKSHFCCEKCCKDNYDEHKIIHKNKNKFNNELKSKNQKITRDLLLYNYVKNFAPNIWKLISPSYPDFPENALGCAMTMLSLAKILSGRQCSDIIENDISTNFGKIDSKRVGTNINDLKANIMKTNEPTTHFCIIYCESLSHYFTIVQDITDDNNWVFRIYQAYCEGVPGDPKLIYSLDDWLNNSVEGVDNELQNAMNYNQFNNLFLNHLDEIFKCDFNSPNLEIIWRRIFGGFGKKPNRSLNFLYWKSQLQNLFEDINIFFVFEKYVMV